MIVLLLLMVVAAMGYAPPNYAGSGVRYPPVENYYPKEDYAKRELRKLSDLDGPAFFKADIRYYKNENEDDIAVIKCAANPRPTYLTWILANTGEDEFGLDQGYKRIPGTVPLAGGINITYTAKYGRDGKFHGNDFYTYELQKFRRVGCLFATIAESHIL